MTGPRSADELEDLARSQLPARVFDFVAGGAGDERTLRANAAAFDAVRLRARVLRDVSVVDTTTELWGAQLASPVLVAPMGLQRLVHPDGELATAGAAAAEGVGYVAATAASVSLEDTAAVAGPCRWFQAYVYRDRGVTAGLLRRAEAAGYGAICLTVDTPVLGLRLRDLRHGTEPLPEITWANLGPPRDERSDAVGVHGFASDLDASLSWDDLAWVRSCTRLPLLLKGVTTGEDAARAVAEGVDGVIVSNHGGRQLDGLPATLDALPEVVAASGELPVLLDGGVRHGVDIAVALALGARAVLVGRPVLWALAVGGGAEVRRLLCGLREDLERTLALVGRPSLVDLDASLIAAGHPAAPAASPLPSPAPRSRPDDGP